MQIQRYYIQHSNKVEIYNIIHTTHILSRGLITNSNFQIRRIFFNLSSFPILPSSPKKHILSFRLDWNGQRCKNKNVKKSDPISVKQTSTSFRLSVMPQYKMAQLNFLFLEILKTGFWIFLHMLTSYHSSQRKVDPCYSQFLSSQPKMEVNWMDIDLSGPSHHSHPFHFIIPIHICIGNIQTNTEISSGCVFGWKPQLSKEMDTFYFPLCLPLSIFVSSSSDPIFLKNLYGLFFSYLLFTTKHAPTSFPPCLALSKITLGEIWVCNTYLSISSMLPESEQIFLNPSNRVKTFLTRSEK